MAEVTGDDFAGIRPDAGWVGVVVRPHRVTVAIVAQQIAADAVADERGRDLALVVLTWIPGQRLARGGVIVELLQPEWNPADAYFGHGELQVGIALHHT